MCLDTNEQIKINLLFSLFLLLFFMSTTVFFGTIYGPIVLIQLTFIFITVLLAK